VATHNGVQILTCSLEDPLLFIHEVKQLVVILRGHGSQAIVAPTRTSGAGSVVSLLQRAVREATVHRAEVSRDNGGSLLVSSGRDSGCSGRGGGRCKSGVGAVSAAAVRADCA